MTDVFEVPKGMPYDRYRELQAWVVKLGLLVTAAEIGIAHGTLSRAIHGQTIYRGSTKKIDRYLDSMGKP